MESIHSVRTGCGAGRATAARRSSGAQTGLLSRQCKPPKHRSRPMPAARQFPTDKTMRSRVYTVGATPKFEAPGWQWDPNAKKQDEETPPGWLRLLRHLEGKEPLFVRKWVTDSDPGLNQSLISSGTTISQLFDQDKWENHRSVQRYTRELFKLPSSTVLRRITKPCSIIALAGFLVCIWNTYAAPLLASKLGVASAMFIASTSTLPHTMLGAAISLLLVFRTNSCHARFSEGRALWGRIVAVTRKWSLITSNYLPAKYHERCATYVKVWTTVVKSHLRSGRTRSDPNDPTAYRDDPSVFVRNHLSPKEADFLLGQRNRPLTMLNYMNALTAEASKNGRICWVTHSKMQECIDEFGKCTGGCERLLSTPLPLSYTRHTSRSLFLWLLTMPLCLWQSMGFAMVPALFLMTFVLIGAMTGPSLSQCQPLAILRSVLRVFEAPKPLCYYVHVPDWGCCIVNSGIDELASQIEEPFSILPLTPLTNVIIRETDNL